MTRQGLCAAPSSPFAKEDLRQLIHQLGFVQIDSIRTVERAHHMILFSRNQNYKQEQLRQLLEDDRHLFEHWTHDASLIPTEFYPHWQQRFVRAEDRLKERWRKQRPKVKSGGKQISFEDMMEQVKTHVHENGPTMSRDLKPKDESRKKTKNGWWEWHPSKTALEFLWRTGDLSITRRDGFQKVYDLSTRVIPETVKSDAQNDHAAFVDWACSEALERLGFAASGELAAYWGSINASEAKAWCLENAGPDLIEISVASADGSAPKTVYARPAIMDALNDLPDPSDRIRVISPFVPLIRDRKRLQRLFDFDYRIEIFVPEAKRIYGYYVFPILEKDKLIGRIDMKAQRQDNRLHVTGLWLELGIKFTKGREKKLTSELNRQARFVGLGDVTFDNGFLKD